MSVLSDRDIRRALDISEITIEPFCDEAIQPASLDVRLGRVFWRFRKKNLSPINPVIDPTDDIKKLMFRQEASWIEIQPHEMMLGVTREKVGLLGTIAANVEGKSSIGRLGLSVHVTAGFIDPGFNGHITLEMFNCAPFPIRLYEGMWIGQLKFMQLLSPCDKPYGVTRGSRYTDQSNPEPVTSRVHEKIA